MILAFAFGGLFMIGNNVFATDPNDSEEPGDGGGTNWSCTVTVTCNDGDKISCTGVDMVKGCRRESGWFVECDGVTTYC